MAGSSGRSLAPEGMHLSAADLITNFHSLTSQNIGEKLQNMLCMLLIRLDRETANSECIIIFQCYIGYKTEDRRHNINYNCIEEKRVK